MANNIIKKTILIKGDKGDKGSADAKADVTVPQGAIVGYDEEELPEGYELFIEV